MKKILSLVLAAMMLMACVSCGGGKVADVQAVKDAGKMIIGITEYAPMNYQENGEWTGFDTEFAQKVCEKLGVTAEFIVIDWDNKILELDSKGIDAVWNGMTITDEVKNGMSVSNAYVKNAQVVVMAADAVANYADAASMADLTFAVEAGSAGEAAAADAGLANVTAVVDQATALMEVASGSVDACVIDITMANAMTGEGTSYTDLGYSVELTTEEYGIGFRKGSDLAEEVNKIMAELIADGTLPALAEKYGLTLAAN
ncbi:MAG: transporter substrate-binding domain-containing protein [Clostridia bacterium]|nr:transporter substrate-binding domain-containing protein [Clostridia bacterium]